MTPEQKQEIKAFIIKHLPVLRQAMHDEFNNEWSDDYHILVIETRAKIKNIFESKWVKSNLEILLCKNDLTEEEQKQMKEISDYTNEVFRSLIAKRSWD